MHSKRDVFICVLSMGEKAYIGEHGRIVDLYTWLHCCPMAHERGWLHASFLMTRDLLQPLLRIYPLSSAEAHSPDKLGFILDVNDCGRYPIYDRVWD